MCCYIAVGGGVGMLNVEEEKLNRLADGAAGSALFTANVNPLAAMAV